MGESLFDFVIKGLCGVKCQLNIPRRYKVIWRIDLCYDVINLNKYLQKCSTYTCIGMVIKLKW